MLSLVKHRPPSRCQAVVEIEPGAGHLHGGHPAHYEPRVPAKSHVAQQFMIVCSGRFGPRAAVPIGTAFAGSKGSGI